MADQMDVSVCMCVVQALQRSLIQAREAVSLMVTSTRAVAPERDPPERAPRVTVGPPPQSSPPPSSLSLAATATITTTTTTATPTAMLPRQHVSPRGLPTAAVAAEPHSPLVPHAIRLQDVSPFQPIEPAPYAC